TAAAGKFKLGPIDLEIEQGLAVGFIGPNGAGKSTTINCILGLHKRQGGSVEVCGEAAHPVLANWKNNIGFILSNQAFYENLSIEENLKFFASFYENWDPDFSRNILKRLQLDPGKKPKILSVGERAQLCLVVALSHRPKLMIMDEPTSGLDPIVRAETLDILGDLLRTGDHSLLISTHTLADVSAIADHLAFIKAGLLMKKVAKDDLMNDWRKISFRSVQPVTSIPGVIKQAHEGPLHLVTTAEVGLTLDWLKRHQIEVLESNRISLEEITIHILQGTKV
ncbi:MAG TPA: ABC transporter ATP-binding protein, partial [Oligoflexus sp.]|uniref:ABC transporter ATP-binding protein n=1 Tax=Oligoflexus sp. TaxID=1971216 RepID=UPI002D32E5D6